ncbi:putative kinetochore protein [Podospora conica]|nr:putative kinetochore protein [Schizothecium conicum]
MDTSATTHRKIELQSPADLRYLIANVRRAAADSINAAFPPVEGAAADEEDELRMRIEGMVNDYITQTFTLASPNLSINGLPVDPAHFFSASSADDDADDEEQVQYEPFDPRKRYRIEDLAREEEVLLRSIAQLKRRVPAATAGTWAAATEAGVAADEAAAAAARARVEAEGAEAGRKALEGMGPLDRQAELEGAFRGAVEALGRLKREMPATVAKMERARVAAGYVATEL